MTARSRRLPWPLALVLAGAGCTLVTDFDGLSGGGTGESMGDPPDGGRDGPGGADGFGGPAGPDAMASSSGSSGDVDAGVCARPEPGLLAYYPLDEVSGTPVKDCSGHGHHGIVISPGTWGAGKFGGSFTTSANAGCIDLGKPAELLLEGSSFTVSSWANAQVFGTAILSYYIVGRTATPLVAGWRLGTDPTNEWSTKFYDSANGALFVASTPQQSANVWTHVAATYDSNNQVSLYVNGVLVGSSPYKAILPDATATLRIGCRGDNQGYFHGSIDEVRIYDHTLSPADIAALAARVP